MRLFSKDLDRQTAVIAEIGVNHEGSVDAAIAMIHQAAEAGADAVKFQTYTPERYAVASDTERMERVRRFFLGEAEHRQLAEAAKAAGVSFFSTAVTEDVVPMLAELGEAVKVASGDIDFEPTIRAAAATGKPMILSTGTGTIDEIDRAVGWVGDELGGADITERLVLMHCVSSYPTPIEHANVRSVPFLMERYGLTTGFSNHVVGAEAVLAAVALGAQVIEVHFTDQKEGRSFRDHALSFDKADLAALVDSIGRVRDALGSFEKVRQESEHEVTPLIRKGVVAARDLAADTVLSLDDLMYARPATEFRAEELGSLTGRRLTEEVKAGWLIPRASVE